MASRTFILIPRSRVSTWAWEQGRFPFGQKFRKFRFGAKWKTFFRFARLENSQKEWISGTALKAVPFSRLKRTNGKICVPFIESPVLCLSRSFKRPGFPGLPRVSKKCWLIRVRFLEAFCKQTSGLLRVLCLPRSSARSRKFIAARMCLI